MRVISGRLRGKKLKGPSGLALRPTADRLKQTLFDILGPCVRDGLLLDLFAGTGAIGIEAISRGAREVVFVEQSTYGCRLIRQNLEHCGIAGGFRLAQQEAFAALRRLGREGYCADVIFMDPPYLWQAYSDLLDIVYRMHLAHGNTRVVVEHQRKASLPDFGPGYCKTRLVRQGDHCLTFYRSVNEGEVRPSADPGKVENGEDRMQREESCPE